MAALVVFVVAGFFFAFGTLRQCGASAAVAAAYLEWLGQRKAVDLSSAVRGFTEVADGAKAAQFLLARAARGRTIDLGPPLGAMAASCPLSITRVLYQFDGFRLITRAGTSLSGERST